MLIRTKEILMDLFTETTPAADEEVSFLKTEIASLKSDVEAYRNQIVDLEAATAETVPNDRKDLIIQINRLTNDLESVRRSYEFSANQTRELMQKIDNVKGYMRDLYSECGEIPDYVEEIARLLDITLTKEIQGTASFEISWTASVPLDFDADDFEISFDVNCETYEAEDFDWNEDNCEVSGEDV